MAITLAQLQAIINEAKAATGGAFSAFDDAYYANQNVGVLTAYYANPANAGKSLLQHYVEAGAEMNLAPNPFFNPQYYAQRWNDLNTGFANSDLFAHWIKFGMSEGRTAIAATNAFDGARYLSENPDVAAYVNANLDAFLGSASNGALAHFVKFGAAEKRLAFDVAGNIVNVALTSFFPATAPISFAAGTLDLDTNQINSGGAVGVTTLTKAAAAIDGGAGALDVLRLTGDADIRIDLTNPGNQVRGVDLNGDNTITSNGTENNVSGAGVLTVKNFEIFDAYSRNPLNHLDTTKNFRGDINFDGTAFGGDGVSTDGNIFLGGLGTDTAFGGVGNDFLAGGGVAAAAGNDRLNGERNADFFFIETSALDRVDGTGLVVDGGETADNSAGTQGFLRDTLGTSNDRDWALVEASDDDEATTITLADTNISNNTNVGNGTTTGDNDGTVAGRNGVAGGATLRGIEAVDASGNLYGFLNDVDVKVGQRAVDARSTNPVKGTENYGIGSTAQLIVNGSASANIVVGGYDNDQIQGNGGNDILFGGNLGYLLANKNNPNLLDSKGGLDLNVNAVKLTSDGRDRIFGGDDNDSIVWQADNGVVAGDQSNGTGTAASGADAGFDTIYITSESVGRLQGTTSATAGAEAAALAALTGDGTLRFDLGNANGAKFRDYGGANRDLTTANGNGDQTNYAAALGATPSTTTNQVEGIIATGLGDIDYKAAGTNSPELKFNNQQNHSGSIAKFDVRGVDSDALSTTKFGNYWTDANFGLHTDGTALNNSDVLGGTTATNVLFRDIGDNIVYLSGANDTIEGRGGDDEMGGGKGDDNFIFDFGDGTDIIRRQTDADGDNLWDAGNGYSQDFRADPSGVTATRLQIDFGATDLTSPNVAVSNIFLSINPGVAGTVKLVANGLETAKSIAALAAAANKAFAAIDSSISVVASGNSLIVSDTKGRDISDTTSEGYAVFVAVGNSAASTTATLNPGGAVIQENDRILFVDYLNNGRLNNAWVDNTNSELRNQAQDLVVGLGTSTILANGQEWRIQFQNLAEGDKVVIDVNGAKITRTVQPGQTTDTFLTALANQIATEMLDRNTAAGDLGAATADVIAGSTNERVLVLTQNNLGGGDNTRVYMAQPTVTITPVNGGSSSATWAVANTSSTSIELYNFNGANGNLNAADVLFLGRSGQATLATSDSTAILQTAKDAGETLTGKAATVVAFQRDETNTIINTNVGNNAGTGATNVYHAINGDDQLIGGAGNDTINGDTGDDRIIGSKGTDVVDGGGNTTTAPTAAAPSGETIRYTDVLLFQEADFGAGTKFTVTLDAALGTAGAGKGTVTAVLGAATLGTTTFTNIEEVRTTSNTAQDTIDYSLLSNAIAAATGASANLDKAALADNGAVAGLLDLSATTNYNEGTILNLTATDPGFAYAVDRNNDDDTGDAGENSGQPVAVFGVENVLGGAANDIVNMDQTQAGSSNTINLAGEQSDTTLAGTFTEGRDLVTYNHAGIGTAAARPSITVTPESASNTDSVSMTGGVLTTNVVVDTLIGVEELTITAAATTQTVAGDTLELGLITGGATVNFGTTGVTVGRTLGGQVTPASLAANESNTLEAGGIVGTGLTLGTELLEINGITQLERLNGSAGTDRIIMGEAGVFANANGSDASLGYDNAKIGVNFFANYDIATRAFVAATSTVDNRGLYQIDLKGGDNDSVDYRNSVNDGITVLVDFNADQTKAIDYVVVDDTNNGAFNNAGDRVDFVSNTERFYGGVVNNAIDLSRATEAVTVTFGVEALASANEVKDPNGTDPNAGATKTPDNQVTGANVSTATQASVARFMEASANAATTTAAALWSRIEGSNLGETIVFSQYQDRQNSETLNLRGGNNVVNYTAGVKTGVNDTYTLQVGRFDASAVLGTTTTHTGTKVSHTSTDGGALGVDLINIDRQLSSTNVNTDGTLLVMGSSNSNDTVSLSLFVAAPTGLNNGGTDLAGTNKGGTAVTEAAAVIDIAGKTAGGYHLVDLGSGVGVTSGTVTEDVNLNFKGAKAVADNVTTSISGWENIQGSAFNDRLFGNDNNNTITGNGGNDIYVGRGGGDTFVLDATAAANAERVVYVGPGDTADFTDGVTTSASVGEFDVIKNFDFNNGNDRVVFDLTTASAAGGFNVVNGLVQVVDYSAAAAVIANGAIITQGLDGQKVATDAGLLDMTQVAAKLVFGGNTTTTVVANNTQAIFVVEGLTQSGIYLWTQANADQIAQATELRLLGILDAQGVGKAAEAEAAGLFTLSDIAVRQLAQATGLADTVLFTAGVRDELVYTSLNQSLYGQIDTIGVLDGVIAGKGAVVNGFVTGEDKIDLSAFNLGAQDGLALNAIITRDRSGPGAQITDANATDFFYDNTGGGGNNAIRRAVVVEIDPDDISIAADTPTVQARARIFVDLNGDGQLSTTQDLFIDVALSGANAAAITAAAPVYSDFIFVV